MWSIVSGIFGALFQTLPAIAGKIAEAQIAKTNAKTDQQKVEAEERIKALEARRDVLVSSTQSPIDQAVKVLLTFPPGLYIGKLFFWDKALNMGSTDPLSLELWGIVFTVYGYYFVTDVLKTFKR